MLDIHLCFFASWTLLSDKKKHNLFASMFWTPKMMYVPHKYMVKHEHKIIEHIEETH
jgi:hypothetical protein